MGKQEVSEYDKSYHPPETIKLDYCAAVLAVVLEQYPKAKELYENIKDCMLLPGVQEAFFTIERKIPAIKVIAIPTQNIIITLF